MPIPVFLSYPKPHMKCQQSFIDTLSEYLSERGFDPKTLGVTEYDMDAPLKAIRRLMLESNGFITIAFKRTLFEKGVVKYQADIEGETQTSIYNHWITSPYCQIEPLPKNAVG